MSASTEIAVLSPHRHPRLRYILYQLTDWWGVKLRLFTDPQKYVQHPALARINYGGARSEITELYLSGHPFLAGADFMLTNEVAMPESLAHGGSQAASHPPTSMHLMDDPFAVIFFCLSRYEEYQTNERDIYGRFAAHQSHAHQHGYLERPIVNEYLVWLAKQLRSIFPDCDLQLPPYRLQLTYDIDIPFTYRYRGLRGIGSGIKDLLTGHLKRSLARFQTLLNANRQDPYDVFDWLGTLHQKHSLRPRYFWLLAEQKNTFDPNPPPDHPALKALIQQLAKVADIGIHPSFYSSEKPTLFTSERHTLQEISQQNIEHSRQHFLRFNLPNTYRSLLRAGLRNDHSMGYADHVGFRAGTNLSFYWYDLEKEERTYLRIHPFAAMDVTLRRYHQLCYFDSQKRIEALAKKVKATGGPFTLLWHNSSFAAEYGWEGWQEMYEQLIEQLKTNNC